MSFLNPIALWALAGLAIPVGLHLLSRKEGKTIRMGSVRFLTETATSKFSSIKLNEIILLAIRSALLIAIVLFLTGLVLSSQSSFEKRLWAVVEDDLENNSHVKTLLDSLAKHHYELKKLKPGFPALTEENTPTLPDYYKLLDELTAAENVEAIVIAKNKLISFKAKRIALPDNITWLSYPDNTVSSDTISTHKTSSGDTVIITLAYDEAYAYDKKIIAASLKSLNTAAPQIISLREISTENFNSTVKTDWLIWLSDAPITFSGKTVRYQLNSFNNLLYHEGKNTCLLSSRLDETTAIKNHLSIQLLNTLFGHTIDQVSVQQHDTRSVSDMEAWSKQTASAATVKSDTKSINTLLFIVIALLFMTERAFAFYRKQ